MKTVFTLALALAAAAPNWSAEAHSIRNTRDLTENATLAAGAATTGVGTNPLLIKGYRFFDSVTGEYFAIRGVDYYPRPNAGANDANNLDFFTDAFDHVWKRDIPQFQALNANTIRLYAVDPTADHSAFMCALQAAGIYVMVDLGSSCSGCEITADAAPACYPASYRDRGEAIIAQFAQFDNVLGFSAGNEINHRTGGNDWTWNAPCQKKFIRDMRAFIAGCPDMRRVPVGVVMADTDRDDNAQYYNCRTNSSDELENAEWYGINVYVHCDDISDPAKAAGFNLLRDSFKSYKYSIPAILTEFGCLAPSFPTEDGHEAQRTFHDAKFVNDRDYSDYFNGGFVFEYSTENANSKSTSPYPFTTYGAQNYGLGYLSPEDCDDTKEGTLCQFERFPNFDNLATAYGAYVATDEPTLSTFNVSADRTNPSTCPANSPLLKTFTWESDKQASKVTCPSKQQSRYQCPAVPLNAILNVTTVSNSANINRNASNSTSTVKPAGNAANTTKSDPAPENATEDGEALELTDISSSESASKDKATASGSTIRAKSAAASNSISVVMTLVASAVATALMS